MRTLIFVDVRRAVAVHSLNARRFICVKEMQTRFHGKFFEVMVWMHFSRIMIIKTITYTLTLDLKAINPSATKCFLLYINEAENNACTCVIPIESLIGE